MKSTSTSSPRLDPAFLLIGPPGGGKTSLALGFPSPYILDIDLNLKGPLSERRKKSPSVEIFYDQPGFRDDNSPVPIEDQYERAVTMLKDAARDPKVKTLVVDGITQLDTVIRARLVKENGGKELNVSNWVKFRQYMTAVIMIARTSGKIPVFLCHEEIVEKDDPGGNMMKRLLDRRVPMVTTKIGDAFGGFFTDVLRCEARPGAGGKPTFWVQVSKTAYDDLKNSYALAGEVKVDFGEDAFAKMNQVFKLV